MAVIGALLLWTIDFLLSSSAAPSLLQPTQRRRVYTWKKRKTSFSLARHKGTNKHINNQNIIILLPCFIILYLLRRRRLLLFIMRTWCKLTYRYIYVQQSLKFILFRSFVFHLFAAPSTLQFNNCIKICMRKYTIVPPHLRTCAILCTAIVHAMVDFLCMP